MTASTETIPDKQTKTAEPPAQPAPDWSLLAPTPDSKPSLDSKPKTDAVTTAPVDLAGSPPSLITPADTRSKAENQKTTDPLPTAVPVAAVANPVKTQPQAITPQPEVKAATATPSLAGSEQLAAPAPISLEQPSDPAAKPAPVQPLPPAQEPAQLAPFRQPSQLRPLNQLQLPTRPPRKRP